MRTDRLVATRSLRCVKTFFPLHPETPQQGRPLTDLFAGRIDLLNDMNERLQALLAAEGLEYRERTHTYNSRLAQELGKWAEDQPGGSAIHNALFRAYFVEGVNLAETDHLLSVAEEVGLDVDAAHVVLHERTYRHMIDRDWDRAMRLGVTAVPTYFAGRFRVVGAQPYEILEQLIEHATNSPA